MAESDAVKSHHSARGRKTMVNIDIGKKNVLKRLTDSYYGKQ